MCGIAGKIYLKPGVVKPLHLKKMATAIAHRGPDDEGIYVSGDHRVGLVNRRLAIIDLSPAGHQPMSYKNRFWITFNGEIYNFQTERAKLAKFGYRFHSQTDTEVILALYDKYGPACLDHLRGMFAFAIYDAKAKTVFLARDRLGKKPLKYFYNDQVFIFASELKAILTQPEVSKNPDLEAIHYYLTYGYAPAPLTGFANISKLEPAHYLLINLHSGNVEKHKYWQPDFSRKLQLSESEWCERILSELEEATRLRMLADVPIGAFLSGGVDSSAIVALMAKNSSHSVKTFTIGFEEKSHDETIHARRVANLYQTDHTELIVQPQSIEILPDLVHQYEEPFADSSSLITFLVSKLAREHVTVILNGDGGDENFAGYDHRFLRFRRDVFLQPLQPLLQKLKPLTNIWPRAHRFLTKANLPLADRYLSYNCYFFNPNSAHIYRQKFQQSRSLDPHDQALYADLTSYFPDDLLTKVDIASMAVGLESRSPFTDHKFVELASQIPFNLKLKGNTSKYILKKSLTGLIPHENLYRPKMGFSIPLSKWFTGKLHKYTQSKLYRRNARINQFLKRESVKKISSGPHLWNLLTLELWLEQYFG